MLTSQVVFLKLQRGNPRDISGKHLHGLFYKNIIGSQYPELADYLHEPKQPKPFSISYLYKSPEMYWFRIASWMKEIAASVFLFFNTYREIVLNDCTFTLIKTSTNAGESIWAKRVEPHDFIELCRKSFKESFWLHHNSPTSFKSSDSHIPLPVPEFVIKSVYRQLPDQFKFNLDVNQLIQHIRLKQHQIKSVYNRMNYGSISSFTGKTCWQINKRASLDEKNALWTLFNFAFFSGIGVKTTQGMGMCRVLD